MSADGDKHEPYFTGVVWIKKNQFHSRRSGKRKIENALKIFEPLAVSVWPEGVPCLSKDNINSCYLIPQQTFPQVSNLFSSFPS